jgi:cell division initiation protein
MRKDRVISQVLGEENTLTPSDLYGKVFKRAMMGGYDARDVDEFIERIADVLEQLLRQTQELKTQNEEYRKQVDEFREIESTLRNALVTSQKFGESAIEAARREASLILEEARIERKRVENEAAELPARIAAEVRGLVEQREHLRAELSAILATHQTLLAAMMSQSAETVAVVAPVPAEDPPAPVLEPEAVSEPEVAPEDNDDVSETKQDFSFLR